jgi:hypothetical protein
MFKHFTCCLVLLLLFTSERQTNAQTFPLSYLPLQQQQTQSLTSASAILMNPMGLIDARAPVSVSYTINLLQAINSSLDLQTLNMDNTLSWSLLRQTNDTFNSNGQLDPIRTRIYDIFNPSIRDNQTLKSQFICLPNDSKCNRLSVPRFDLSSMGLYRTQSRDNNDLVQTVDYNVGTYLPLSVECSSSDGVSTFI